MENRYPKLREFGKNLLDKESLSDGLSYISLNAKSLTDAERCSIFIYNIEENELWTTLADESEKIILPYDLGIVGQTIKIKKPILENDPYDNQYFLSDIDTQTGYYTRNLLTAPIFNSKKEIIGVIELLNKEDGFNKNDMDFLSFFAHYISSFIELNSNTFRD